jgi:hypothetical protein
MAHQPLNVTFNAQNHLRRDWLQVGTVLPAINRYVHVSVVGPGGQILWCVMKSAEEHIRLLQHQVYEHDLTCVRQ